jgi:small subunit ribosomal protein S24e
MTNRLLNRKQMVVDVTHGELATPARKTITDQLAKMYKAASDCIVVYGLHTSYGGGKTTGFANIYDSLDFMKKNEKRSNLVKLGQATKIEKKARQQRKQLKNRKLRVRGTKKDKIGAAKK